MNGNARRFHPRPTIRQPYVGGNKLENLILVFGVGRFHSCFSLDMLEGFILVLLLKVTSEKKRKIGPDSHTIDA